LTTDTFDEQCTVKQL